MGIIFDSVPDYYTETYLNYFDLDNLRKVHKDKLRAGLKDKVGFHMEYARQHPVTFAYFMLGKKLRVYQAYALDKILNERRVALNWARRLGKSTILGLLAFGLTFFNREPKNAMEKFTAVGIISKEDKAAKTLLAAIRNLIYDGDAHMYRAVPKENYRNFFSKRLSEPNNTEQITWDNRSWIKSFPPTKKVRGEGFSRAFIDEIAFLNPPTDEPDNFYYTSFLPTVADTNGPITISSTPNGKSNLFYDLFDPDAKKKSEFMGIWYNWEVNKDEPKYANYVQENKKLYYSQGREKMFRQEFYGDFTQTQDSFFELDDIDNHFDKNLSPIYEWKKTECGIGIDYGISASRTVITVKTKHRNVIKTLYRKVFPNGFDINEIMNSANDDSIFRLMERYNTKWIVPDDCDQADSQIKQMKRLGLPVFPYSFRTSVNKNKAYYTYRLLLRQGAMKGFSDETLRNELIGIQREQLAINERIGKSKGSKDDVVDSDIFATVPFFEEEETGFGSIDYEQDDVNEELTCVNQDTEWSNLLSSQDKDFYRKIDEWNQKARRQEGGKK